jgi:large subunit ribosomal protein L30
VATLKITLVKSTNNAKKNQIATIKALGLRKIGQTVEKESNPAMLGMVRRVSHLVNCEEA